MTPRKERPRRGRGEGSITRRPDGSYLVRVSLGVDTDGKRVRYSKVCATRPEAIAWRDERLGRGPSVAKGPTLADFTAGWLVARRDVIEAGSWQFYASLIRCHIVPHLGPIPVNELDRPVIARMIQTMAESGASPDLRRKVLSTLRTILNDAVVAGLVTENPAKGIKPPKARRPALRVWTREEVARFLAAIAGHPWEAYFLLALDSGMRPSEIFALHWTEVDGRKIRVIRSLEKRTCKLKAPKTAAGRRTILIGEKAAAALAQRRVNATSELVFPGRTGKPTRHDAFAHRVFKPIVRELGLPDIPIYNLRHTAATLQLAAGAPIRAVSARLGHEGIDITLRHYAGVLPDDQEKIAGIADEILGGA